MEEVRRDLVRLVNGAVTQREFTLSKTLKTQMSYANLFHPHVQVALRAPGELIGKWWKRVNSSLIAEPASDCAPIVAAMHHSLLLSDRLETPLQLRDGVRQLLHLHQLSRAVNMHSDAASQGGGWQGCGTAAHIFCIRALTVGSAIIVFICSMIIGFCIIFIACCTTAGSRICSCSDDGAPPSAASSASSPPRSRSAERGSTAGRDADEARDDATAALAPADAHATRRATMSDLILERRGLDRGSRRARALGALGAPGRLLTLTPSL